MLVRLRRMSFHCARCSAGKGVARVGTGTLRFYIKAHSQSSLVLRFACPAGVCERLLCKPLPTLCALWALVGAPVGAIVCCVRLWAQLVAY